ncbi:MAG: AbrB/MazE/SpoVT family DNA-binding domain-containing protein [Candidatus Hydrogenedentes bacterium]|nr:AbrB/MazE/SpoVT family DNA-binding domain-containing protein [Candidatus Hydrogenedentota bacterium]
MLTKVQRWGNSLGVRIPKSFAEEAQMSEGSEVDVRVERGELVVRATKRKKYRLDDLVRKITPKNRHAEVTSGGQVGREVW